MTPETHAPSRRGTLRLGIAAAAAAGLGRTACAEDGPMEVVATFSILADFARQVGGDRVRVASLVGPDGDAHSFEPTPADAARVAAAKVVVVNGLGMEGWLPRLVQASGGRARTVTGTAGVTPIRGIGHGGRERDDPHAFGSPLLAKVYVANIRDGFAAADPAGQDIYRGNTERYVAELDRLDADVRSTLGRIPPDRRRAITTHDAFKYFSAAYGIEFLAPAGVSTEAEISAQQVGLIVRQIRQEKIPAVFLENISDPRLMTQISQESGARIGGQLYSDALSPPGGPASTYLDLVRHNARTLADALAP